MGRQRKRKTRMCPVCGRELAFFHGCLWDYDYWYCVVAVSPESGRRGCGHEEELNTTTCPEVDDESEAGV